VDIFHYPVDDNVATQLYQLVLCGLGYVRGILAFSGQVLFENSVLSQHQHETPAMTGSCPVQR